MIKQITLSALVLFLFGCNSYVQVIETDSLCSTNINNYYIYETDTLKITYNFWKEKGIMNFSIYNKLDKPIYVDWKKSSYIDNSIKLNYWVDQEKTKTLGVYKSYYYNGPLLKPNYEVGTQTGISTSSKTKVERITFIPPSSHYYRSQYNIFPVEYYELNKNAAYKEVTRNDNPRKKTRVYEVTYNKDNSPLVFRNFITYSTTENFENEFYVNNEFYIEKILEMNKKHFEQYRIDSTRKGKWHIKNEEGDPILFSPFKDPRSFYLEIPSSHSVEFRK